MRINFMVPAAMAAMMWGGAVYAQEIDWRASRAALAPETGRVTLSKDFVVAPGAWSPDPEDFMVKVAEKLAERFGDLAEKGDRPVRIDVLIRGFGRERRFGSETAINFVVADVTVVDPADGTVLKTFEGLTGALPESFNPVAGWLMRQFVPDPAGSMANALAVTIRRTWDR